MRYLLDTHALAWWLLDLPRLGSSARAAIVAEESDIFVSAVSAFEIATKFRLGKWPEMAELVNDFTGILEKERFTHLAVSVPHAFLAGHIPAAHKDPFDRMLAGQCRLENLSLITIDAAFGEFGIDTIW
jgi:PIN domain nuclease of toxin-antitoxin system